MHNGELVVLLQFVAPVLEPRSGAVPERCAREELDRDSASEEVRPISVAMLEPVKMIGTSADVMVAAFLAQMLKGSYPYGQ